MSWETGSRGEPGSSNACLVRILHGVVIKESDLWLLTDRRAAESPDLEGIVDRHGRRLSFKQFRDEAEAMAAGLADMGVQPGDVVAWELPTWIDSMLLSVALHRLGTIQVPIIAIYREREVTHCCSQTNARWLITPDTFRSFDFAEMGEKVAERVGLRHVVVRPGEFPSLPGGPLPEHQRNDGTRWIFHTSGTTSAPKGVQHTDAALSGVGPPMAERMGLEFADRYALAFPFAHVGGIIVLFMNLEVGATSLIDDDFDAIETSAYLAAEGVTHAGTGTPFHLAYLAAQREQPDIRLFAKAKCFPGGASPKPPKLHQQIKDELGSAGIISSWGLTESPILTFSDLNDPNDKLATTEGRPMPGVEVKNVDGELLIRAPQMTSGYVDSSLDKEAFEDGWFKTGDLGFVDDEGFVTITGRKKDVIVRNGENVSAKEVEDLLYEHANVTDAAVIGIPDERTGERVVAVVTTRNGTIDLEEVRSWLKGLGLRSQAIPERLEVVDVIPRNAAGKVAKQELKDRYTDPS